MEPILSRELKPALNISRFAVFDVCTGFT